MCKCSNVDVCEFDREYLKSMLQKRYKRWIVKMNRGEGVFSPISSSHLLPPACFHQPSFLFSLSSSLTYLSVHFLWTHSPNPLCASSRLLRAIRQFTGVTFAPTRTGRAASPLPAVTIATGPELRYSGCDASASALNDSNVQFEIDRVPWHFDLPGLNYRPYLAVAPHGLKSPSLRVHAAFHRKFGPCARTLVDPV